MRAPTLHAKSALVTTASLCAASWCGLYGCSAQLGGEALGQAEIFEGNVDGEAPTSFRCDDSLAGDEPAWRRLTHRQYERTLRDVLSATIGEEEGLAVLGAASASRGQLPVEARLRVPEDLHGSYRRLSQSLDQGHVDSWYAIGVEVGRQLAAPSRIERAVGECATAESSVAVDTCLRDFVVRFGELTLRRPLTEEDIAFYAGFYGDTNELDPEGFADVIGGFLNAPEFLYHIEHGAEAMGTRPGTQTLTAFEVASRLSYHFWDTMPDRELFESARTGALLAPEEYSRQVDRLLSDARAMETAREFFRDWAKLEDLPEMNQLLGVPAFDAFVGDDVPTDSLRENMIEEVLDLVEHHVFREPGGLRELFTSDLALPKTADLASLYGVEPSMAPVSLGDERPGILTRAAFLATGTANTRPILKGVFLRTNLLCERIPAPPDNAAADVPDVDPLLSTRQVVEEITEGEGTACAGCHTEMINPLGFPTENFDALGRFRSEQPIFDETGSLIGTAPVDTAASVTIGESTYEVDGAPGLMDAVLDSEKLEACLTRHYFRYSFGRWEDLAADGCVLERMRSRLVESGSIADLLREVALLPEFTERRFQ